MRSPLHVMLVAGEPSGDLLGAVLMRALKARSPGITFSGIGGPQMESEGMASLVPMADLAIMGLVEILPRLSTLRRHMETAVTAALAREPDALVTIDSPGFNLRLAKRLATARFPIIHFVAPSVWAWKPRRAAKMAPHFDHLLALLPFEPPYFSAVGLPCTFVGHPVVERDLKGDGAAFRRRHGIAADTPLLVVLPGSRRSEIGRLLPVFGETVRLLAPAHPGLTVAVPTLPHIEHDVRAAVAGWPVPAIVTTGEMEKADAFAAARAALAASGTVSLELARAGVPMVIGYRFNAFTTWLVKRLVKVKWVSLVNLILNREAIPERILDNCTADRLAAETALLLADGVARARQLDDAGAAIAALRPPGGQPSQHAADVVLQVAAQGRRPR